MTMMTPDTLWQDTQDGWKFRFRQWGATIELDPQEPRFILRVEGPGIDPGFWTAGVTLEECKNLAHKVVLDQVIAQEHWERLLGGGK